MLTLLTATGARPDAFLICERYMRRQTYDGPVRWIIVDDGEEAQPLDELPAGWVREIIRPKPFWKRGENTQGRNLLAGLNAAEAAADEHGERLKLVFIEDDDWYAPSWLDFVAATLNEGHELMGEARARFYNVRWGFYGIVPNEEHASLRCTAIQGKALKTFRRALSIRTKYYDWHLWKLHQEGFLVFTKMTVGLKGLPGRDGVTPGHRTITGTLDEDGAVLSKWIGDDADLYGRYKKDLFKELAMTGQKALIAKKPFRYNKRPLAPGDKFAASGKDAKLLKAVGKAEDCPPPAADAGRPGEYRNREPQKNATDPTATDKAETKTPAPSKADGGVKSATARKSRRKKVVDEAPENKSGERQAGEHIKAEDTGTGGGDE